MFKQVFRLTFVTFIWKQYKRIIVSTALLFGFLWFVGFAHSEYLEFATNDELAQANIGSSFFIKWAALLSGVVAYLLFHYLAPSRKQLKQASKNKSSKVQSSIQSSKGQPLGDGEPDPFDQIRGKEKLRSRAEIVIDEYNKN